MSWDINKKVGRPKKSVKPFGSDAQTGERTVFGSNSISDDLEENLSVDFERGWGIVPQESPPTRQDFNAGMFTNSLLASYLFQQGVPEWDGNQAYFINSIVQKDGQLFVSTDGTDGAANIGNDPAEGAKWVVVSGGGGGGSGTNLITNPQASQGVSGWKMTGGVFESQNSDDGVGGKVFKVTMNAADNVLLNDAAYVTNDTASLVNTCSLYYKQTGGASDISAVDVLIESSDDGNVWTELKRETLSDVGIDKWGYYQTQVVFPDIGSQIRFSFVATGATQFEFDNVHLGSIVGATGAFIGEWEAYTPNLINCDNPENAMTDFEFRRIGEDIEIRGQIEVQGANALIGGNVSFSYPKSFQYARDCIGIWQSYNVRKDSGIASGRLIAVSSDMQAYTASIYGDEKPVEGDKRWLQWNDFLATPNNKVLRVNITVKNAEWQGQGTSIAMTESLVESNYRFSTLDFKTHAADNHTPNTLKNGEYTTLTGLSNPNNDSNFDGTYLTIKSDGFYDLDACVSLFATNKTSSRDLIGFAINETVFAVYQTSYNDALYPSIAISYKNTYLKKGDRISLQLQQNTGYDVPYRDVPSMTFFTVQKSADYTAGTLPSFGIATESEYGLVKAAQVFSVGSIQQSILTEAQFQAENGSDWKLWGASTDIAGTKLGGLLGTDKLPDATGRVFRNAGGAAADLGEGQDDATAVNGLSATFDHTHGFGFNTLSGISLGSPDGRYMLLANSNEGSATSPVQSQSVNTSVITGDTETRMINITLNTFIKVN